MLSWTLPLLLTAATVGDSAVITPDIVLRNATLVDGSGQPGRQGDLALKGDRIVALGKFQWAGTPRVLDCAGLVIAPGFIDLHTHSDTALTVKKTAANLNYLMQGLTTAVTGNCGSGPIDVAAYFKTMETQGIGSNVIHQVPHNNVRLKVMGNSNRAPTAAELTQMEGFVDQGMRDGAWGLSTGLIYNPGTYSKTDELIDLAKVAARHGGFYASHIRDEGTGIFVALEEVLEIGARPGCACMSLISRFRAGQRGARRPTSSHSFAEPAKTASRSPPISILIPPAAPLWPPSSFPPSSERAPPRKCCNDSTIRSSAPR